MDISVIGLNDPWPMIVTLLASVIVTLRATGRWRLVAPFISLVLGSAVAAAFGVLDGDRIASASWFGVPVLPDLSFELSPEREYWALLPSFAILTLVLGLKTISDGVVIQQGSRRRPRAIDFRRIQGIVSTNGVGMLLAGLATTLPPMANASYSLSLINLNGVAARRAGIGVAMVKVFLACFSKFAAVLLTIPGPVVGAVLIMAMGMLFVSGWQTILRDGLDPRRVLVLALATLLFQDEVGEEVSEQPRLVVVARPQSMMVELEFVATTRQEDIEDQLADLTDEAPVPTADDLSLRLLWDHASAVRRQKLHGVDIETVQVEGSA